MPFAGLDLHKKDIEAVILNDAGQITLRHRFPTTRESITDFAQRYLSPLHQVAVEATFNTWAVVAILRPFVHSITVGNPLQTRAIAQAKIKTDKIDAKVLAHLLRLDYLPSVWIPDDDTRNLRLQTTERACLTGDRTRLKNRIHSILHQRLIQAPTGDLFSPENLAWLNGLALDPTGRQALNRLLGQLALVEQDLLASADALAHLAYADPRAKLLMSLPGVGFATAQVLLAAFGDLSRFPSADKAASYLGLAPSTYQSGEKTYHGHITKQGNSHARWMLVEAVQHLDRHPGPLGVFFRRIAKKKNRNVAIVAAARKLVTIAWHMLKNNEPYRYAEPQPTEEKYRHLRTRVTGQKRKTGPQKGRPPLLGDGLRSRLIKGLPELYAAEGLPPLATSKPGEAKSLERSGLSNLAAQVLQTRRVPRGKKHLTNQ
jgi:transposase